MALINIPENLQDLTLTDTEEVSVSSAVLLVLVPCCYVRHMNMLLLDPCTVVGSYVV
jgi:hypothetical protein